MTFVGDPQVTPTWTPTYPTPVEAVEVLPSRAQVIYHIITDLRTYGFSPLPPPLSSFSWGLRFLQQQHPPWRRASANQVTAGVCDVARRERRTSV